jgi:hypothetical protein
MENLTREEIIALRPKVQEYPQLIAFLNAGAQRIRDCETAADGSELYVPTFEERRMLIYGHESLTDSDKEKILRLKGIASFEIKWVRRRIKPDDPFNDELDRLDQVARSRIF